jgi:hypothetical protein
LNAFPNPHRTDMNGMTLRDYFAAKAMQGLLASDVYAPIESFATRAYAMADAMMEARNAAQN